MIYLHKQTVPGLCLANQTCPGLDRASFVLCESGPEQDGLNPWLGSAQLGRRLCRLLVVSQGWISRALAADCADGLYVHGKHNALPRGAGSSSAAAAASID